MTDRYQSGYGLPGTMPTEAWFAALMRGVDGQLGSVLDVGCAEGVMSLLALDHGAESVLGIGLHDDRLAAAKELTQGAKALTIREMAASEIEDSFDTVIYSMMAHWLGRKETARIASLARRWFLVVFRIANDHYAIPANGHWFPSIEELDETVGGIRTHEELLLTQDNGKEVWAATYRRDMVLWEGWVYKHEALSEGAQALIVAGAPVHAQITNIPEIGAHAVRFIDGLDLHGDPPFRPQHPGKPVICNPAVAELARGIAKAALTCGWYPTDFSPRNIIVNDEGAHLVDLGEIERTDGTVPEPYRTIWETSLGRPFSGRLADLL